MTKNDRIYIDGEAFTATRDAIDSLIAALEAAGYRYDYETAGYARPAEPEGFAEVLTEWMKRMGYGPTKAAAALGVTPQSIRNWLRGRKNAHQRAYMALMAVLEYGATSAL